MAFRDVVPPLHNSATTVIKIIKHLDGGVGVPARGVKKRRGE